MSEQIVVELERELAVISLRLTEPWPGECLVCFVDRMVGELGCTGSRWMRRYRDEFARRATALEKRMMRMGAGCDCEILRRVYEPNRQLSEELADYWMPRQRWNADAEVVEEDPNAFPMCLTVRRGSTQPCALWQRIHRS